MSLRSRDLAAAMALALMLVGAPVFAQDAMQGMDMPHAQHQSKHPAKKNAKAASKAAAKQQTAPPMDGMDMSHAGHARYQPARPADATTQAEPKPASPRAEAPMPGMGMSSMQGKDHHAEPAPHAESSSSMRSPDYSDGYTYGAMSGMDMRDDAPIGTLMFDRLEAFDGRDEHGAAFDAQAWYGNDENKLWLKMEGETAAGRLRDLRIEALWDRPASAFWDTQLGVRHDAGNGPGRNWAAFGVQGSAPYWFEVEATFYVGPSGRTAFRFESEYELLLTQRLILQPRLEANLYGRNDPQRGIGSGLSSAAAGLRLRYEFTRQFAPYIGVEFERKFGRAAGFAHRAGESAFDPRVVAGVRFWF